MLFRSIRLQVFLLLTMSICSVVSAQDYFVSDLGTPTNGGRIMRFSSTGQYINNFADGTDGIFFPTTMSLINGAGGQELWVGSGVFGGVKRFDLATGNSLGSLAGASSLVPGDIVVNNGTVYISDLAGTGVHRFSPTTLAEVGTAFGPGVSSGFLGSMTFKDGSLYVADYATGGINKFAPDGTPQSAGSFTSGYVAGLGTGGITFLSDGSLIAAHNLQTGSPDLAVIRYDGTTGVASGSNPFIPKHVHTPGSPSYVGTGFTSSYLAIDSDSFLMVNLGNNNPADPQYPDPGGDPVNNPTYLNLFNGYINIYNNNGGYEGTFITRETEMFNPSDIIAVPEPSVVVVAGLGLVGFGLMIRRKK
jgi:hypothetical protein